MADSCVPFYMADSCVPFYIADGGLMCSFLHGGLMRSFLHSGLVRPFSHDSCIVVIQFSFTFVFLSHQADGRLSPKPISVDIYLCAWLGPAPSPSPLRWCASSTPTRLGWKSYYLYIGFQIIPNHVSWWFNVMRLLDRMSIFVFNIHKCFFNQILSINSVFTFNNMFTFTNTILFNNLIFFQQHIFI